MESERGNIKAAEKRTARNFNKCIYCSIIVPLYRCELKAREKRTKEFLSTPSLRRDEEGVAIN